jgi:hypothetical protein
MLTRDYLISTVVDAADDLDLTDLPTVKSELSLPPSNTANDAWLSLALTEASMLVTNYCRRPFVVQEYSDRFRLAGCWNAPRDLLRLSQYPVTAMTSVIEDGVALATSDYELKPDAGILYRLDSSGQPSHWAGRLIVVRYHAGYAAIPADAVAAVLRLVTMRFKGKDRDPLLREQEQPGLGRQTFWIGGPPMKGNLPAEIAALLAPYEPLRA